MEVPIGLTAALQGEAAHVVKGTTTDTLNEKNSLIRRTLTVLEDHQSSALKILRREDLSQQGKMAAGRTLGTNQTASSVKFLWDNIKRLREKDQRYRTQFFTLASDIDNSVERMLLHTYLWKQLDPLDQAARVTRFMQAAQHDEINVMTAMLANPFSGPMVDEEVKERALTERAKRLWPQDHENYVQTNILLEFLTMIRDWIARWLFGEVGVELSVIRTNLGDDIADALADRSLTAQPQLAGLSK
jgi:hypothetical protein